MRSITIRILIAVLTFTVGLGITRLIQSRPRIADLPPVQFQSVPIDFTQPEREVFIPGCTIQRPTESDLDLASDIAFVRGTGMAEDVPLLKRVFRREASKSSDAATVIETDLRTKKQRYGRLNAHDYNDLITSVKAQGLFCMKDEYAIGWTDAISVHLNVTLGDQRKLIRTSHDGLVPTQVGNVFEAVDKAVSKVRWNRFPL